MKLKLIIGSGDWAEVVQEVNGGAQVLYRGHEDEAYEYLVEKVFEVDIENAEVRGPRVHVEPVR